KRHTEEKYGTKDNQDIDIAESFGTTVVHVRARALRSASPNKTFEKSSSEDRFFFFQLRIPHLAAYIKLLEGALQSAIKELADAIDETQDESSKKNQGANFTACAIYRFATPAVTVTAEKEE